MEKANVDPSPRPSQDSNPLPSFDPQLSEDQLLSEEGPPMPAEQRHSVTGPPPNTSNQEVGSSNTTPIPTPEIRKLLIVIKG